MDRYTHRERYQWSVQKLAVGLTWIFNQLEKGDKGALNTYNTTNMQGNAKRCVTTVSANNGENVMYESLSMATVAVGQIPFVHVNQIYNTFVYYKSVLLASL